MGLAAVSILPNTSYVEPTKQVPFWHSARTVPGFFTDRAARRMLGENPNILVLPYGSAGDANDMLWQAYADMSFRMPQSYISTTVPPEFLCWPVVRSMLSSQYPAERRRNFLAFLSAKKVDAVVVANGEVKAAAPFLAELGPPRTVKGVHIYRIPRRLPDATPPACLDEAVAG